MFIGRQFGTKTELDVEVEVNGAHAHIVVLGTEAEGVEQLGAHQLLHADHPPYAALVWLQRAFAQVDHLEESVHQQHSLERDVVQRDVALGHHLVECLRQHVLQQRLPVHVRVLDQPVLEGVQVTRHVRLREYLLQ